MLPNRNAKDKDFTVKVYGYQHTGEGIHSNVYMKNVRDRLDIAAANLPFSTAAERASGAMKIRDELQKIAMELAAGTFPTVDPS